MAIANLHQLDGLDGGSKDPPLPRPHNFLPCRLPLLTLVPTGHSWLGFPLQH
jgi:hypothetical protein